MTMLSFMLSFMLSLRRPLALRKVREGWSIKGHGRASRAAPAVGPCVLPPHLKAPGQVGHLL